MKKNICIGLLVFFTFNFLHSQQSSIDIISTEQEITQKLDELVVLLENENIGEFKSQYDLFKNSIISSKNPIYVARLEAYYATYNLFIYNYSELEFYLNKSLSFFKKTKNRQMLIYLYNLKGMHFYYTEYGRNKTNIYFEKAVELYEEGDVEIENIIDVYFNLAYSYYLSKKWNSSYKTALKTIALAKKQNKASHLNRMYFCKGFSQLKQNSLDEALIAFKECEKLVKESEKKTKKKVYYKEALYLFGLSELYREKGDYHLALSYLDDFNERVIAKNELYRLEISQKVEENRTLVLEQEKLKKVEAEFKLKETQSAYDRIMIIFSISAIVVLVYFLFQQSKLKKINLEKNTQLTSKNNELELAKKDVEQALTVKVDFLNSISHELKTPLYAINSITQLMKQDKKGSIDESYVDILTFSGNHLLRFINEVIETNIHGKKNELIPVYSPFNMDELISNLKETFFSSLVENKNNTYDFKLDKAIPDNIIGDTLILSRILINLLNNASKNTEKGFVFLEVTQLELSSFTSTIEFSVKDTGRGLSEKQLTEIDLAFKQNSNLINRVDGFSSGLGMGLTMVNRMLKLFNSKLIIKTELNKGSTFKFSIVFDFKKPFHPNSETLPINANGDIDNSKVLVVDDNKINQIITQKIVASLGINSDIASNGQMAIDRLQQGNKYRFILMDIMMPDLNGYETTKIIKSKFPNEKVIALTAISINDNSKKIIEAGFDDVMSKPYKLDQLKKIIEKFS